MAYSTLQGSKYDHYAHRDLGSRTDGYRINLNTSGQSRTAALEMPHARFKAVGDRSLGRAGDRRTQPLPLKIDASSAVDVP